MTRAFDTGELRKRLSDIASALDDTVRKVPGLGKLLPGQTPAVDVYDTPDSLVVYVDVPGMAREDIDLRLCAGELVVAGHRDTPRPQGERIAGDRFSGEFSRSVPMPPEVDAEAEVTAVLENGVLIVRLPKAPVGPGRRIDVAQPDG